MNTSIAFFVAFCLLVYSGKLRGFSGRIMLLFTPGAMRDLSPLASSVAEHSGTKWSHLFLIIGASLLVCPLGVFLLFIREDPTNWILILQYIALSFFSSRMNRLKLLLAPSISLLAGYTIAEIAQLSQNKLKNTLKGFQLITTMLPVSHHSHFKAKLSSNFKSKSALVSSSNILDIVVSLIVCHSVAHYISVDVSHFVYNGVTQYMHLADRPTTINDDVKNSYDWIASNSPADSKIASWWDYGYQIAGFTDRTVVVDNFTSIALSIAIMGMIMAGKEDLAIKFLRHLKINYILVFAPGVADHMMGHDISKMYWMIRISQGVFPQLVDESLYIGRSHLDVGEKATEAMIDSVMYKTCFYDFDKIKNGPNGETGVNPSTGTQVHTAATNQPIKFKYLEEAFSSQYRTIRIFKVKQPSRYWVEKEDVPF